jgi:TetR/AcrR family fatty acid metabolism transcriptional regulator
MNTHSVERVIVTARKASQERRPKTQSRSSLIRARSKEEAILRAAIKVFARNGFFNSKVADVAREAGVADGTVYLYFKNKEDILVSIFDRITEQALSRGRARLAEVEDPAEKLRRIVYAHLECFANDRDLAIVFQVELRGSTKFMEQFSATRVSEYLDLIGSVIKEGQQRGVFRSSLNTGVAAKLLFGALDEMVTNWVLSRKRYDLVSIADAVIDIFFNGIACQRKPC